jgi:hypothetical protein
MVEHGSVPVSTLKLVTRFIQNLVCKSTPKVVANVSFVPANYISAFFTVTRLWAGCPGLEV